LYGSASQNNDLCCAGTREHSIAEAGAGPYFTYFFHPEGVWSFVFLPIFVLL
jgi:hypothetical protein